MLKTLTFIDTPGFTTERLNLRKLEVGDLAAYFKLCSQLDTRRPYGVAVHRTPDETLKTILLLEEWNRAETSVRWGFFLKDTGALIGDGGFWRFDPFRNRGEIGLKISADARGHGLGEEAARGILEFGFRAIELNSVEASIHPENQGSRRLFEKLGFVQEGYRREFSYDVYQGRYVDSLLYSMLASNWG